MERPPVPDIDMTRLASTTTGSPTVRRYCNEIAASKDGWTVCK